MPLQATSGAASYDATGGGAPVRNFIEDVFSTYLYTGNGSTQTITNGIDLTGKGGLVWMKGRSGATAHGWYDTARGATFDIGSNLTTAQTTQSTGLTSFGSTGFSLGALAKLNTNTSTYASWTFRKQPKFFDVVTYTGTGANRTVAHSLGSVPGCIFVKRTDTTGAWQVYHRSLANTEYMVLNTTAAVATGATRWNSTTPTSTEFSLGTDVTVNASGGTYVAYVFAHDAGGFGLTGADNVISCGSYTGNTSTDGPEINLGYEPQWIMVKNSGATGNWLIYDTMRGWVFESTLGYTMALFPNLANAEINNNFARVTPTGFKILSSAADVNTGGITYTYIAIRRGPMKVPTTGTSVAALDSYTGTSASPRVIGSGLGAGPIDFFLNRSISDLDGNAIVFPGVVVNRQIGRPYLRLNATSAETADNNFNAYPFDLQDGVRVGPNAQNYVNGVNVNYRFVALSRAPSFMDLVCFTGTGTNISRNHNLGVAPELWIVKSRDSGAWEVGSTALANTEYLVLNTNAAKATGATRWNSTYPTASVFTTGTAATVNGSGVNFVSYFFATCPGVSKVGSYTGNGATQAIDCGFTGGARMVLVKRTSGTGDWLLVYSISASTEQYVSLNGDLAAVTNVNLFDTNSSGFTLRNNSTVNASGETYIFLAIA
jgi:hypothetical protein